MKYVFSKKNKMKYVTRNRTERDLVERNIEGKTKNLNRMKQKYRQRYKKKKMN